MMTFPFIESLEPRERDVMARIHELLMSLPGVTDRIRYGIPFFYYHSWFCYMNPQKKGGVELVFIKGQELSNAQGLLDPKDRKQVAGITYSEVSEIEEEVLLEIILEAIMLDERPLQPGG